MRTMTIELVVFSFFAVIIPVILLGLVLLLGLSTKSRKPKLTSTEESKSDNAETYKIGSRLGMAGLGVITIAGMMLISSTNYESVIKTYDVYDSGRDAIAKVTDLSARKSTSGKGRVRTKVSAKLSFDGHETWADTINFPGEPDRGQELRISYLPESPEVLVLGHRSDGMLSLLYNNLGIFRLIFAVAMSILGALGIWMVIGVIFIRD